MTIAQRLAYGLTVVILLVCKVNNFYWYCIADLIGDCVGIAIGFVFNRGLYFGKSLKPKEAFKELKENISSGILSVVASLICMFYTFAKRIVMLMLPCSYLMLKL